MHEINKDRFGLFLSQLRKEKGMTQKDLAQKLYISDKAVSKWETSQSLPDISLLTPLAEILGVTVTELLQGRRMDTAVDIEAEQREDTAGQPEGTVREKPRGIRLAVYLLCLAMGAAEVLVIHMLQMPKTQCLWMSVGFGAGFGAYFWLFAMTKLPTYYDSNRIGAWSDGPVRMNVPGVRFTNRNWPYILKTLRIWSALTMTVYPLLHFLGIAFLPVLFKAAELYVFLVCILGGMILPLIIVGRKFE